MERIELDDGPRAAGLPVDSRDISTRFDCCSAFQDCRLRRAFESSFVRLARSSIQDEHCPRSIILPVRCQNGSDEWRADSTHHVNISALEYSRQNDPTM